MLHLALVLLGFAGQGSSQEVAPAHGWDDFPVLVWRQRYRGRALPESLWKELGGVNLERDEPDEWLRRSGGTFYVGHAPGRNILHLDVDAPSWVERFSAYDASGDERLLAREPCLSDPKTRAELFALLNKSLAARAGRYGLGYSLGDEVSLTPNGNPFDLCRSPHCEKRWRQHARSLELEPHSPTTDELRLALGAEDFGPLGPWLARRRFHQDEFLALLHELAERARGTKDRPPVGLLGLSGSTAFGGVEVARAARWLDFMECYPVGLAREELETLRALERPGLRTLATVFVDQESPGGSAWQAWEHWLRGGDGLVIWSDGALEDSEAHRARLFDAVSRIRAIGAELGPLTPRGPRTIALLEDFDTKAASFVRDALLDGATWRQRLAGYQARHGTRERRRDAWQALLHDVGLRPGALSFEDLTSKARERFPVLLLCDALVLDPADVVRLEQHLSAGGYLLCDGARPWIRRDGSPWNADPLAGLRKRFPERVRSAPDGILRYPEQRLDPERGARLRHFARELVAPLDPAPLPLRCGKAQRGEPWLVGRWSAPPGPDGRARELVAWLPHHPTLDERRRELRERTLEVAPESGWNLQWVHPRSRDAGSTGAVTLAPGEAGVLLATRTQ